MGIDDPLRLLGRLKLGREEYCQRLLTMLILDGPYPPWNSRNRPGPKGSDFLRTLDDLCFDTVGWSASPLFVDEFDLPKRHDDEPGAALDYALLWDDRLWMIELKTETASHRPGQIPTYFELADHHYPTGAIDLTYLTSAMGITVSPPAAERRRFVHVTWSQVIPLLTTVWGGTSAERRALELLTGAIDSIGGSWAHWRTRQLDAVPEGPPTPQPTENIQHSTTRMDPRDQALTLAEATSHDGRQRALDYPPTSLEALKQLRLAVRQAIRAAPATSAIRHVQPWVWNANTSGGHPLTKAGEEIGYELQLSRYCIPVS